MFSRLGGNLRCKLVASVIACVFASDGAREVSRVPDLALGGFDFGKAQGRILVKVEFWLGSSWRVCDRLGWLFRTGFSFRNGGRKPENLLLNMVFLHLRF